MLGLYIHIPFCRKKCSYCDFYSLARKSLMQEYTDALKIEIQAAKQDLEVRTVYFGGGTPSYLPYQNIDAVLQSVASRFSIASNPEITLEANPEDINEENLKAWKDIGINRLSIGIQSLNDDILKLIRRNHTARKALNAIDLAQRLGFNNISADLIYGLPALSFDVWKQSLKQLLSTGIQHLSAYHLGLEQGTLMHHQVETGKILLPDEDKSIRQFEYLFDYTETHGFPWYEISNFASKGNESKHNSSYWNFTPYLGFGAGAHSFINHKRFWNKPDIKSYLKNPNNSKEFEELTPQDMLNDYLITHLRTRKGISVKEIQEIAPWFNYQALERKMFKLVSEGKAQYANHNFQLNVKSLFISDTILKDIIYI